jgi:hypothetical protein
MGLVVHKCAVRSHVDEYMHAWVGIMLWTDRVLQLTEFALDDALLMWMAS